MPDFDLNLLALLFIGLGFLLFVVFAFLARQGFKPALRPLDAFDALSNQVGQAIESGGRVHVSLGKNSLIDEDTGTTLAGLEMLSTVTENSAISDRSPVATTADATTLFLMGDTMRRAYEQKKLPTKYEPTAVRLIAFDPVALAGGITSLIPDDDVRANVLIGSFGPEAALIAEAGRRQRIPQTIGSDRLEAQATAYAMADYPLIGEEIYTIRAYTKGDPASIGSVAVQDVLRWVAIGAIVVGLVLKTLGG
jgi:hypothetical protein